MYRAKRVPVKKISINKDIIYSYDGLFMDGEEQTGGLGAWF